MKDDRPQYVMMRTDAFLQLLIENPRRKYQCLYHLTSWCQ